MPKYRKNLLTTATLFGLSIANAFVFIVFAEPSEDALMKKLYAPETLQHAETIGYCHVFLMCSSICLILVALLEADGEEDNKSKMY